MTYQIHVVSLCKLLFAFESSTYNDREEGKDGTKVYALDDDYQIGDVKETFPFREGIDRHNQFVIVDSDTKLTTLFYIMKGEKREC